MMRPASGLAQAHDCTLVVVDMQTRAAAALRHTDAARIFRTTATLLRVAQILSIPVICTEHREPSLGAIDPRIAEVLPASAYRLAKTSFCAWADDDFANAVAIAARRQIVICGLQAHVGVAQTAIRLAENDYGVFVVEDGVGSHDPALASDAMLRLRANAVTVISSESLVFEWLADADAAVREQVLATAQET